MGAVHVKEPLHLQEAFVRPNKCMQWSSILPASRHSAEASRVSEAANDPLFLCSAAIPHSTLQLLAHQDLPPAFSLSSPAPWQSLPSDCTGRWSSTRQAVLYRL